MDPQLGTAAVRCKNDVIVDGALMASGEKVILSIRSVDSTIHDKEEDFKVGRAGLCNALGFCAKLNTKAVLST